MPKGDPAGYLPNVKKARAQGQGKNKLKNVILERRSKGRKGAPPPTGFQRGAERKESPVASSFKGGSGSIGSFGPKGGGNSSSPVGKMVSGDGLASHLASGKKEFKQQFQPNGSVQKPLKPMGAAARRLGKLKGN